MSNGALYRYFDGKAAIIEAIAAERHAQERALLDAALRDADPRRAVHDFVVAYFAWLTDPDELRRRRINVHVWAEALADERLAAIVAAGVAPAATRSTPSTPRSRRGRSRRMSTRPHSCR